MRHLHLAVLLLALAGCSITYPVTGNVKESKEEFLGTATTAITGSGSISMTSSEGPACTGKYSVPVGATVASGNGTFTCNDGRSGIFSFTGDTSGGTGFGTFNDGKKLTFFFGNVARVKLN